MAKQPRPPTPIHGLVKQAHAYNAALRARLLRPLYRDIMQGLIDAYAAAELLHQLDANRFQSPSTHDIAQQEATRAMQRMRLYHRSKLIQTFRQALGVNVTGLLAEPVIDHWMRQAVSDNVDLIVTIPPRFHSGLKQRIEKQLRTRPFDRKMLMEMLRDQYGASGYQLRRLTRDQTTKAVGALTQARHEQLGITHYIWRTSQDGRVREKHALREGQTYAWSSAPFHPGSEVQCRCTAEPVIPKLGLQPSPKPAPLKQAPRPAAAAPPTPQPPIKRLSAQEIRQEVLRDDAARRARLDAIVAERTKHSAAYADLTAKMADTTDEGAWQALNSQRKAVRGLMAADSAEMRRVQSTKRSRELSYLQHGDRSLPKLKHPALDKSGLTQAAPKIPKKEQEKITKAMDLFRSIMPATYDADRPIGWYFTQSKSMREFHRNMGRDGSMIAFGPNTTIETMVHELGHAVEAAFPDVLNRSIRHLSRRTRNDTATSMNKLFPGQGYGTHERTKPDKFLGWDAANPDTHAAYTGRIYRDGRASEILSTGLQRYYRNAADLARIDPELFDHVVDAIKMLQ